MRSIVLSAMVDVAERCFFAMVEPCDGARFAELAASHHEWLAATVRFQEREWAGAVTCRLPMVLAERMFDAFTGRDAEDPQPSRDEVLDLVGEFANMICGAWLTRAANHKTFALEKPMVSGAPDRRPDDDSAVLIAVDDMPVSVDIRFFDVPAMAVTGA